MVGGADVAPSGGRDGDEARAGAAVQEGQRGGRGMTVTHVVGGSGITQIVPAVEVVDAGVAAAEHGVVQDRLEEVAVGLEAIDLECDQSPGQAPRGRLPGVGVGHDLGHQGVERGADRAPRLDARVGPQPRALRPGHVARRTRRGPVVLAWPLGAEPGLDGVAGHRDVLLGQREWLPGGHHQLQPHQVEAGDQFGHPVLHLQPRVHLQEEELTPVDQELDRPHALVPHRLCGHDGGLPHAGPGPPVHQDGRRLLNHLLVAPLHRALPVEQVQHRPLRVPDDLDLHVTGRGQVPLEEDLVGAERGGRLAPRRGHRLAELVGARHQPHAAATPARRCLDQEGEAARRRPTRSAASSSAARVRSTTTLGRTGTPAADTVSFARTLCPMTRIDSGVGPTQAIPARAQASGSSGFSERNP